MNAPTPTRASASPSYPRTYAFRTEGHPLGRVIARLGDEIGIDYLAFPTPLIERSRSCMTRAEFVADVLRRTADEIERTDRTSSL